MDSAGSVTSWFFDLIEGDEDGVRLLWERYFCQLVQLARRHLQGRSWGGRDEEDVALSALHTFVRRTGEGAYAALDGRDELWRLLAVITRHKAISVVRQALAARRGGAQQRELETAVAQALDPQPTPAQTAELLDEADRLLNQILAARDGLLRSVAVRKLEGAQNYEIAADLGVSVRTVERKLALIRKLWEADLDARARHG